jgi:hypothetical protein
MTKQVLRFAFHSRFWAVAVLHRFALVVHHECGSGQVHRQGLEQFPAGHQA